MCFRPRPPLYGSPAIASTLFLSSQGHGVDDDHEDEVARVIQNAIDAAHATLGKVQREVYHGLRSHLYPSTLQDTLIWRCCKYFPSDCDYSQIDFSASFQIACKLGSQVAFSLLKTLLGAWITHRRVQLNPRLCIFCQRESDSLQHLIDCTVLWRSISDSLPPFLPFIDDPLALLGVSPPNQILGCHYAFLTYHTLRRHDFVSQDDINQCIKSLIASTSVHKHLIEAHFGKLTLREGLAPPTNQTSQTSQTTRAFAHRPPNTQSIRARSCSASCEIQPGVLSKRLRMSHARRAVLQARGLAVGSGPIFHATTRPEADTGRWQGAVVER